MTTHSLKLLSKSNLENCYWTNITDKLSIIKKDHQDDIKISPRYSHKAIMVKDWLVMFGGCYQNTKKQNKGLICNDLYALNTQTLQWLKLDASSEGRSSAPPALAAASLCNEKSRLFLFGGLSMEHKFNNRLYELNVNDWHWKYHRPRHNSNSHTNNTFTDNQNQSHRDQSMPAPRLGATLVATKTKLILFGGLGNALGSSSNDTSDGLIPEHYNDVWIFNIQNPLTKEKISITSPQAGWEKINTLGIPPTGRESHSALIDTDYNGKQRMIIYGGMCGHRLGDIWILNLESYQWSSLPTLNNPVPRSMHSCFLYEDSNYSERHMIVFGGYCSEQNKIDSTDSISQQLDKNNNTENQKFFDSNLYAFGLETYKWKRLKEQVYTKENSPPAGVAGSALCYNEKSQEAILLFGRNDDHETFIRPEIFKLALSKPKKVKIIQSMKMTASSAEISFSLVSNATDYRIELRKRPKMDQPKLQSLTPLTPQNSNNSNNISSTPGTPITPITASSNKPLKLTPINMTNHIYPWKLVATLPQEPVNANKSETQIQCEISRSFTIKTYLEDDKDRNSSCPLAKATSYDVRVRAENNLGYGPWNMTSFKTQVPGLPASPTDVEIETQNNHRNISIKWKSVDSKSPEIQFCIFLATRAKQNNAAKSLVWRQIWIGKECSAILNRENDKMKNMLIENGKTVKFRVAAKNTKGFGPAQEIKFSLSNAMNKTELERQQARLDAKERMKSGDRDRGSGQTIAASHNSSPVTIPAKKIRI